MDSGFIERLTEKLEQPTVKSVDGVDRLLAPQKWVEVRKVADPAPEVLLVSTLTGFMDYVEANRDDLDLDKLVVHVADHATVHLRGQLRVHDLNARHGYVRAAFQPLFGAGFTFGQYVDAESFLIALQTLFMDTPDRNDIVMLVAGIRESSVKETFDDGVAQEVRVAAGVALIGNVRVPSPVRLTPFRTFREIDQPDSLFILRLASSPEGQKPKLALFEADGGAWKLTAIERISAFLKDRLKDTVAVIA